MYVYTLIYLYAKIYVSYMHMDMCINNCDMTLWIYPISYYMSYVTHLP